MAMQSFSMVEVMVLVSVVTFQIVCGAPYNSDKFGSSSLSSAAAAAAPSPINGHPDDEALPPGFSQEEVAYMEYCAHVGYEVFSANIELNDEVTYFWFGRRKEFIDAKLCKPLIVSPLGKGCYDLLAKLMYEEGLKEKRPDLTNHMLERASQLWNYCTNVVASAPAPTPLSYRASSYFN